MSNLRDFTRIPAVETEESLWEGIWWEERSVALRSKRKVKKDGLWENQGWSFKRAPDRLSGESPRHTTCQRP